MTNTELKIPETNENFEALLNEQFGDKGITGSVVKGTIIRLTPDFAIVDVGLKSEGRIPLREFGQNAELKVGDQSRSLCRPLRRQRRPDCFIARKSTPRRSLAGSGKMP